MNEFFENGLNFSCKRCSVCCRHEPGYVYLSETDLSNLCLKFKMSKEKFIDKYCRRVPYYNGTEVLCLLEKDNFDCILWDGGCTAYEARPVQCSTYPFWTSILSSESAWNRESDSCPGINCGQHRTRSEILENLLKYEENKKSLIKYRRDKF